MSEEEKNNLEGLGEIIMEGINKGYVKLEDGEIKVDSPISKGTLGRYHVPEERERKELREKFIFLIKDKRIGEATEEIVKWILKHNHIYTTKNDEKTEMWIYKDGIYVPQGKSEVKEQMRGLLDIWFNSYYYGQVISKLEPDTFIDSEKFFNSNYSCFVIFFKKYYATKKNKQSPLFLCFNSL